MKSGRRIHELTTEIAPYPQEAVLLDAVAEMSGERLLCTSLGLAQFGVAAAQAFTRSTVSCTYLDLYRANLARNHWRELPSNLRIECAADFADDVVDVVALPTSSGGEAELTRDFLQAGHGRLRERGKMYVSTENRKDVWLGEQLRKLFRKLEARKLPTGMLYVGTKTEPLKKLKNFSCEFAFRDRGRLIHALSRPGVFSHRHIDPGARQLIEEMQIDAGARVLDIGCGAGVVALAASCRGDGVHVHAVDSNARAIQCAQRGAELNGLANLTTELNALGNYSGAGSYDLALANPPYYASFRIDRHFVTAGRAALRHGGRILVVTKRPDWYEEHMPQWFEEVVVTQRKGYHLVHGVRPAG